MNIFGLFKMVNRTLFLQNDPTSYLLSIYPCPVLSYSMLPILLSIASVFVNLPTHKLDVICRLALRLFIREKVFLNRKSVYSLKISSNEEL